MTSNASAISMKLALDAGYAALARKNDLRSADNASNEGESSVNGSILTPGHPQASRASLEPLADNMDAEPFYPEPAN